MRWICLACICLLASCDDPREPLAKGQVMSIADMKLELKKLDWGNPREVVEPLDINKDGRLFWTVHYDLGPKNEIRVVFVNAHTHWAQAQEGPAREVATELVQNKPLTVVEQSRYTPGPYIVILSKDTFEVVSAEVNRLNALAKETGLLPMFSVRTLPNGEFQLVYGWDNEQGIKKIDKVGDWIEVRTTYKNYVWLNLIGE